MTLHTYPDIEQGSDKWHDQRRGLITASTIGRLITKRTLGASDFDCPACDSRVNEPCLSKAKKVDGPPTPIKTLHSERGAVASEKAVTVLEPAHNDESRGLTALLVAERITGWTDPTFTSHDMWRGIDSEPLARDKYSEKYAPVTETGFMRLDGDGYSLGFSPDGLVGDDGLIEVKAPRAKTHILTVLADEVPPYHMPQLQAGLLVSGREWVDFISYSGGLPMWVKRVLPDPRWFDAILNAAQQFETTAAEMVATFETRTTGLAQTERLLTDMEISI